MSAVPKSPRRLKVSERYALARQTFLNQKMRSTFGCTAVWRGVFRCECKPDCDRMVAIEERRGKGYWTDGHVDHIKHRSTHPELREDMGNLRLLHPICHRRRHEDELKGRKA